MAVQTTREGPSVRQVNRALKKLPDFARDAAQHTMNESAFEVAHLASAHVRRRTGLLAESIDWIERKRSFSAVVVIRNISKVFYWKFVEYGTKAMGAFPFLRPAAAHIAIDHRRRLIANLQVTLDQLEREANSGS